MKLKHQLAAFAALALFAGCSENDEMGTQKQSAAVPAVTNEAKPADTAVATTPPPAPAPPPAPTPPPALAPTPPVAAAPAPPPAAEPPPASVNPAGNVTPPAAPDAAATNASPTNSDAGDKK